MEQFLYDLLSVDPSPSNLLCQQVPFPADHQGPDFLSTFAAGPAGPLTPAAKREQTARVLEFQFTDPWIAANRERYQSL